MYFSLAGFVLTVHSNTVIILLQDWLSSSGQFLSCDQISSIVRHEYHTLFCCRSKSCCCSTQLFCWNTMWFKFICAIYFPAYLKSLWWCVLSQISTVSWPLMMTCCLSLSAGTMFWTGVLPVEPLTGTVSRVVSSVICALFYQHWPHNSRYVAHKYLTNLMIWLFWLCMKNLLMFRGINFLVFSRTLCFSLFHGPTISYACDLAQDSRQVSCSEERGTVYDLLWWQRANTRDFFSSRRAYIYNCD